VKQSILHQKHLQAHAKISDIHGWQLPQQFSDLSDEYSAVRTAVGLFDLSFIGKIAIQGKDALSLLQTVFTRNLSKLPEGNVQYSLACNETGGILDEGLLFHISDNRYFFTSNAMNTDKMTQWLQKHATGSVEITNRTKDFFQIGLQGPRSIQIIEALASPPFKKMKPRSVRKIHLAEIPLLISRTGFTGEHGYELFIAPEYAEAIWDILLNAGKNLGILPCGYAARDILRLEMGYRLYGNDITEEYTPFEAGLGSFVDFQKDFIGKDALFKKSTEGVQQKLVGFELLDKGIPKAGNSIFSENHEIGIVTSGGQSPSARKCIGFGYVATRYAQPGQEIEIEVKDREIAAKIVDLPFYRKK